MDDGLSEHVEGLLGDGAMDSGKSTGGGLPGGARKDGLPAWAV